MLSSPQSNQSSSLGSTDFKMKLLGWVHRKFRQNNNETFKDFAIGNGQPQLDEQHYYQKPPYCTSPFGQAPKAHRRRSFAGLETSRVEEDCDEEDSSAAASELFHGFLAIGTLGADPSSTPTFSICIDNITGKETEVTENELKIINDELEKVLGAEAKENGYSDSSRRNSHVSTGRNSHVSTGRSSHGSTITLSGKPSEGLEINGNGSSLCPLQEYLLGSAVESSETTAVAKKENRTSLGELFQKNKIAGDHFGVKYERDEKQAEREAEKSAVQLMKKMLKKKMLHASTRSSTATADSALAETKLQKILHMFHKKVHPESSTTTPKLDEPHKIEKKRNISCDGRHNYGIHMLHEEDITIFPQKSHLKERIKRYNSQSNTSCFAPNGSNSNGYTEHWIKTDADYLVLEL